MRINLFNAQAPNSIRIPVTVNITQNDLVHTVDGEQVFLITLSVGVPDINGNKIDTVVINDVLKENVKEEIERGLSLIASRINWQNLEEDTRAPVIKEINPKNNETSVSIDSNVSIVIKDEFPATGIDESSIKLFVNELDITAEIQKKIKDNEVIISWVPRKIKN